MKKVLVLSVMILGLYVLACQPQILAEGDKAPAFTLLDLEGKPVALNDLLRSKEVLLNFWASWCLECRQEMPQLNEFAKKYKGKVEIVGVNLRESKETVRSFIKAHGIEYKMLLDDKGNVANLYGIVGVPTNILINKDGLIKKLNLDVREMESYFRQL